MNLRSIALLCLLFACPFLLSLGAAPLQEEEPLAPVTLLFVRHAETAASTTGGGDPELSEDGQKRARALARLLGQAGVTHLFCSEFRRTRATLEPLAQSSELEIETVSARDVERQLELLSDLAPGSVAVVAGHSNTVPALVEALAGVLDRLEEKPYGRSLPHDEYSRLYVVSLPRVPRAAPRALELSYGD